MAKKKKRRHGKIEKKKSRPFMQFKLGVLLLLILFSFCGSFGIYMLTAASDPDYWQNEILSSAENSTVNAETKARNKNAVANPVPESERAGEERMSECAFIGEFSPLTAYYDTKTELVFTDSVTGMSESRMNSISRNVTTATAIYIWYNYPEDTEESINALKNLVSLLQSQHNKPVYLLNVIPSADPEQSARIDEWNSQLFTFCDTYGVHYVDVSTSLKTNENTLVITDEDALYQKIGELILTHIAD